MAKSELDVSDLKEVSKDILKLANDEIPKEVKKHLRKSGNSLKKEVKKLARQRVKKDTGRYQKSIKTGKVYKYKGIHTIRVYSSNYAPHSHLIEYGHRIVKNGRTIGFVSGKLVFKDAKENYTDKFTKDTETFLTKLVDERLL